MNLENIKLNKSSQYKRRNTVGFHFCEVPKTGKGKETERRMVVARGWGWLPGAGCQGLGVVARAWAWLPGAGGSKGSRGCSLMGTEFQVGR